MKTEHHNLKSTLRYVSKNTCEWNSNPWPLQQGRILVSRSRKSLNTGKLYTNQRSQFSGWCDLDFKVRLWLVRAWARILLAAVFCWYTSRLI